MDGLKFIPIPSRNPTLTDNMIPGTSTHTYHKLPDEKLPAGAFFRKIKRLLHLLYPQVRPYRRLIIASWLVMATLSAASAAPVLLARKIVEDFQDHADHLLRSLSLLAAIIVLISIFRFLCTLALGAINYRVQHALEIQYATKIVATPLSYYDTNTSGAISIAPFLQLPLLTRLVELLLGHFVQAALTIIAILGVLFYLSPSIGAICTGLLPLFFLGSIYAGKEIERNVKRTFAHIASMHSHMLESLISIKSIRTLGISGKRISELGSIAKDTLDAEIKTLIAAGITRLGVEVVFAAGIVAVILILRFYYAEGSITLGLCAAVLTGFGMLVREIRKLNRGVVELRRIAGATPRVVNILSQSSQPQTSAMKPGPVQVNSVRIERLCFSYKEGTAVLNELNMVFFRGCITAIIGESGAGKSTIADLLLRLRRPHQGRIVLNTNTPLAELDESWLREAVAFVDQEPFLFNLTIRENLLLSEPNLSDTDLYESLAAAGADTFVRSLPAGLDTRVGEGGGLVSVGEKQRIALARALTKNPSVLVLDEVTSALDIKNEATILQTLKQLAPNMVIVLITHKESVADQCDRVYYIKNTAAELIKKVASLDAPNTL